MNTTSDLTEQELQAHLQAGRLAAVIADHAGELVDVDVLLAGLPDERPGRHSRAALAVETTIKGLAGMFTVEEMTELFAAAFHRFPHEVAP